MQIAQTGSRHSTCNSRVLLLIHALCFNLSLFVLVCQGLARKAAFSDVHKIALSSATLRLAPAAHAVMKQLPPEQKHSILLEYIPRSTTHSFAAPAARHGVAGGGNTVQIWHQRWDGTAASLQRKEGGGRPRVLSEREVQQHVRAPILRANRAHKVVHYAAVVEEVKQKTGKQVSARTVRRYGKEELQVKQRRGKKRTAEESECTPM